MMKRFEVGERYIVHNCKQGMIVIRRLDEKLLVSINGVEFEKRIFYFSGAENVWTDDDWHVANAHYKQEEN